MQKSNVVTTFRVVHLLTFVILFFTACQYSLEKVEKKDDKGNIVERFTIDPKTRLKQGAYQRLFAQTGGVYELSQYDKGVPTGEQKLFYESGKVAEIRHLDAAGHYSGPYQAFFEDGKPKAAGQYVNNAMQGEWLNYHPNGQLKERVQFNNNIENGIFVEYHPNGKIAAKGTYLDGDHEQGALEIFDTTGTLIKKMNCEMGVCHTIWAKDSLVK